MSLVGSGERLGNVGFVCRTSLRLVLTRFLCVRREFTEDVGLSCEDIGFPKLEAGREDRNRSFVNTDELL